MAEKMSLSDYFKIGAPIVGGGLNVAAALMQQEDPRLAGQVQQIGLSNQLSQMDINERARIERQRRNFSGTLGRMFEGAKLVPAAPLSARLTNGAA